MQLTLSVKYTHFNQNQIFTTTLLPAPVLGQHLPLVNRLSYDLILDHHTSLYHTYTWPVGHILKQLYVYR